MASKSFFLIGMRCSIYHTDMEQIKDGCVSMIFARDFTSISSSVYGNVQRFCPLYIAIL